MLIPVAERFEANASPEMLGPDVGLPSLRLSFIFDEALRRTGLVAIEQSWSAREWAEAVTSIGLMTMPAA